ncbi:MAG: DUF2066 domain-containing protein [Pseudomonadota bacterium]|nr:DUF2066 domain-containing protein [Pseudomonadota bacterium]
MVAKTKNAFGAWFLGCLLGVMALNSQASSTININTGKVAVDDRNSRTQRAATREALSQLLVKLTGQGDISGYQALQAIRDDANRYLRAYRYTEENGQLYFVAEFDRKQLESVLIRERLPIWGDRRPDALLWLAVENEQGERRIIDDGQTNDYTITARLQADVRGVPLTLPLMDLDDALRINAYDVWGLFPRQLNQAAARYNVDFVLGARVYRNRTREIVFPTPEPDAQPVEDGTQPIQLAESGAEPMATLSDTTSSAGDNTVQGALFTLPEGGVQQIDANSVSGEQNVNGISNEALSRLAASGFGSAEQTIEPVNEGPLFTQEEFSTLAARAKKGRYSLDFFYGPANGASSEVIHDTLIGDEPNELIAQLINRYADYLGQNYAILPTDADSEQLVELSVGNLHDLRGYVAVQQYLQALSVTESVTLVRQQGTVSTFGLRLLGSERDLRAVLSLDNRLQPLRDAFGQPLEGMHYFWSQ